MKIKSILLFVIVAGSLLTASFVFASNKSITEKLSGRILLQVEEKGEAWYVSPKNQERSYLRNGSDALDLMKAKGVGVSNYNLSLIPVGDMNLASGADPDNDGLSDAIEESLGTDKNKADTDGDGFDDKTEILNGYNPLGAGKNSVNLELAKKFAGEIFLQVEKNGEAWYINPVDSKRYFLGRPDDAYNLMRNLGLGITNQDLEKIKVDGAQAQSLGEENESSESEAGNQEDEMTYEAVINEDLQAFSPKLSVCEIGESTTYTFEMEADMFGIELYTYTKNKVDILSKEEAECEISMETIEKNVRVLNVEEIVDDQLLAIQNDLIEGAIITADEFETLKNTKIEDITEVDKEMFIENGLDSDLFLEENYDKTLRQAMIDSLNTSFSEVYTDYEDMDTRKKFCTGKPDALMQYLQFATAEDGSMSASCSLSTMVCEYENGVICVSTVSE